MIQMQAMTDFLRLLETRKLLSHEDYLDVHLAGNMALNPHRPGAFESVIRKLVGMGLAETDVRRALEEAVASSSAISYLNMGRPETILSDTDEAAEERQQRIEGLMEETPEVDVQTLELQGVDHDPGGITEACQVGA